MAPDATRNNTRYQLDRPDDETLLIQLSGDWKLSLPLPAPDDIDRQLRSEPAIRRIGFESSRIRSWDSGLLTFLLKVEETANERNIRVDNSGLPQGAARLIAIATAVPPQDTYEKEARSSLLARLGKLLIRFTEAGRDMIGFLGESVLAFGALVRGKARFQASDLIVIVQECGAEALPIVTLISILVGMILAFVGAMQLKMFGAQVYVANLVTLGMAREMGAMMTGIIMAGRTGAAFAAKLGSMQVNEEVDALQTLGIAPMEFLVLPRLLALVLMMPLLCIYADLMGIFGGLVVAAGMFDITTVQYFNQAKEYIGLIDFEVGIFKSAIFGAVVALCGCYYGIRCGRSSAAVGLATTSAVVSSIVLIIVSDSLVTFVTTLVGI